MKAKKTKQRTKAREKSSSKNKSRKKLDTPNLHGRKRKKKHHKRTSRKKRSIWRDLLYAITIVCVFLLLIGLSVFKVGRMQGYSMLPTLSQGDVFMANRFKKIQHGDLIYLKTPGRETEKSVRRVIGLPGDEVQYKNDVLYLNGEGKPERYLNKRKKELGGGILTEDFSLKDLSDSERIPAGYYLVLGDNRQSSSDSRSYGLVEKKAILGVLSYRIWPFDFLTDYT